MKEKLGVLLGIFLLLTIFSVVSVSAIYISKPANGATVTGSTILNVTNSSGSLTAMRNCSLYVKSGTSGNTTWTILGTFVNMSASASFINATYTTNYLADGSDFIFNETCWNLTVSSENAISTATILVDNTIPQSPSAFDPANTNAIAISTDPQTFTTTVVDTNTTNCSYNIYRGGGSSDGTSGQATYSENTCTFTKSFTTPTDDGNWYWDMTASDGKDTAKSGSILFSVQIPNPGGGLPVNPETGQPEIPGQTNIGLIIAIILIIFVIGLLIYYFVL